MSSDAISPTHFSSRRTTRARSNDERSEPVRQSVRNSDTSGNNVADHQAAWAKLEQAEWLASEPWIWGGGSVAWLTRLGTKACGLGGLRPVKPPPARTTISHAVLGRRSATRLERRRRDWRSARELALDPDRWSVTMRAERGYTTQRPDLVGCARPDAPVALIAESGGRREDRQKKILEGWRDAVWSCRYTAVR